MHFRLVYPLLKKIFTYWLWAFSISLGVAHAQPLLEATELQAKLKNASTALRVIDIRESRSYKDFHIEGAQSAPFSEWRGPLTNPGNPPDAGKLNTIIQRLGLTPNVHAVVVSTGVDSIDFGSAAWVYWVLKELGIKEVSILNGGMKAWAHAGYLLDDEIIKTTPSTYTARWENRYTANKTDVAKLVDNPQALLLDARPTAFYEGETRHFFAKVPGTIKGAQSLNFEKWFKPNSPNFASFVSTEEAKKIWQSSGLKPATTTVTFCNTGHWGAIDWFALSEILGVKGVKLYPQSLVEWSADPAMPMVNVPSRAKQLLIDAKVLTNP